MKNLFYIAAAIVTLVVNINHAQAKLSKDKKIPVVEFKQAKVQDAVNLLAEIAELNIAATREAGMHDVTLRMKDTNVKGIIDTMARVSGLWYRYMRATDSYLLMTAAQYQSDIVVFRDDLVRTFELRHQNVEATAKTIRNLYGERIVLTLEQNTDDFIGLPFEEVEDATVASNSSNNGNGGANNNRNSNSNNNNRNGRYSNQSRYQNQNNNRNNQQNNGQQNITRGENGSAAGEQLSTLGNFAQSETRQNLLTSGQLNSLQGQQVINDQQVAKITDKQTPIYITINKIHNLLFVRTTDETVLEEIEQLIDVSDKPTPQVLLEMEIIEVKVGDSYNQEFDLGFNSGGKIDNLNLSPTKTTTTTTTTREAGGTKTTTNTTTAGSKLDKYGLNLPDSVSANFALPLADILAGKNVHALTVGASGGVYNFINDKVNASIELLKKNGQARTLSKPVVLASNNRQAKIFLGDEQIIATGISNLGRQTEYDSEGRPINTTNQTVTVDTERRKVGNTLYLLPSINADRTVTIDILQDQAKVVSNGAQLPYFDSNDNTIKTQAIDAVNQTNIKSVVVAKDGLTVALGGMVSSSTSLETSKVPLLGDIPFLGAMFRQENEVNRSYQYIMLITPHIIMSPEETVDKSKQIAGFDYNKNADHKGKRSFPDYGFEHYIDLTRFAVNAVAQQNFNQVKGDIKVLPASKQSASAVFPIHGVSARPKGLWRAGELYISAFEIRNHTPVEQTLSSAKLHGNWLAATFVKEKLSAFSEPGDSSWLYLVSDQPFQSIIADIE